MTRLLSLLFVFVTLVGCDGVGVGDRRAMMVSPEEKEFVNKMREVKKAEDPTKIVNKGMKPRALLRPMSADLDKDDTKEDIDSVKEWQFKWSWDKGVATPGKPSADNPKYDDDGNLIVSAETIRAYKVPDISSGIAVDVNGDNKIRAVLEVEACEFRVPKLGWFTSGLLAGDEFLAWHVSKEWLRIFKVSTGVYVGRDFDTNDNVFGVNALIIKF